MVRCLALALIGLVVASTAVTAAPAVPSIAVAVRGVARPAPIPTLDFTHLFNRLTIPLGMVPVGD